MFIILIIATIVISFIYGFLSLSIGYGVSERGKTVVFIVWLALLIAGIITSIVSKEYLHIVFFIIAFLVPMWIGQAVIAAMLRKR